MLTGLRRLALADLDETMLKGLIDGREHLLVEWKQEIPPEPRFGAAVASFANTLGGWLVIGVEDDTGRIVGWQPPGNADVQSHLGHLVGNEVTPLPPFVAAMKEVEGKPVGVMRVFESADTPHIVRQTGAVYVRDSRGKQPITDQAVLMALARRGEQAQLDASSRIRNHSIPPASVKHFTLIATAAPFTVTAPVP
jgi:predicted HTH transcriptional regulator